jgi:hypothetical protein
VIEPPGPASNEPVPASGIGVASADPARRTPYFKLAVICRGIAAPAAGGAMHGSRFAEAQRVVEPLIRAGQYVPATS